MDEVLKLFGKVTRIVDWRDINRMNVKTICYLASGEDHDSGNASPCVSQIRLNQLRDSREKRTRQIMGLVNS